jgi:hypothetical protein
MITNLITFSVFLALGSLWWWSGRVNAARQIEEVRITAGADLLAALPDRDERCPTCTGTRCWDWRHHGAPCLPDTSADLPELATAGGRHEPTPAFAYAVPGRWNPLPLRQRVRLAPTAWAARLGRPVQLGLGRAIGGIA